MYYAKFLSYYLLNMYLSLENLRGKKKKSLWKSQNAKNCFHAFQIVPVFGLHKQNQVALLKSSASKGQS